MKDDGSVSPWPWVLGGTAVLLLIGGGVVIYGKTRGLRNNNPGNVRPLPNGALWKGQVGVDNMLGGPFAVFGFFDGKPGEFWGLRTIAHVLGKYQTSDGLKTIEDMIARWAPNIENDTMDYIRSVSNALGIAMDQPIDLQNNPAAVVAMVKAITIQENGANPYADDLVAAAVAAA